jgi:hypothetical protein
VVGQDLLKLILSYALHRRTIGRRPCP